MWVISNQQMDNIVTSILQQREYRSYRILRREDEFANMWEEDLKEKIRCYASKVAGIRISEEVLLEFIRQCIRDPEILKTAEVDIIVSRISGDMK
jgi:maleate cis-trans isomerase